MPVSLIYMFVRMLLGALLPRRSGRCRQGTRDRRAPSSDRRAPSSGGPPSLSSASVIVEEPRADRIDVPGGRVAQDLRSFGSYTNRTIYG
jgi:hypothetical protein